MRAAQRQKRMETMENSKIEWTTHTFNPWRGCTKVSDGCKNCYAETLSNRYNKSLWGPKGTRELKSDNNWKQPIKWNASRWICAECGTTYRDDTGPGKRCTANVKTGFKRSNGEIVKTLCSGLLEWIERPRVFCASMADVFEDRPELVEWRLRLFDLIRQTPNLDWLLLTKRPENVVRMIADCQCLAEGGDPNEYAAWIRQHGDDFPQTEIGDWLNEWTGGRPPVNVWIGTSVENQEVADKRIPELFKVPAVVRFLSVEPLLGPIDLRKWLPHEYVGQPGSGEPCGVCGVLTNSLHWVSAAKSRLDWVIVGGESGTGARPMEELWVRAIREECINADLPLLWPGR